MGLAPHLIRTKQQTLNAREAHLAPLAPKAPFADPAPYALCPHDVVDPCKEAIIQETNIHTPGSNIRKKKQNIIL
jgi:hypothetical protein